MSDSVPLPNPFSDIPRLPLLFSHRPPIEPLPRLTEHLESERIKTSGQGSVDSPKYKIFIKREDCNSGLAGGGNKVRKLEYVLHDAKAQGANVLVTTGGVQSNHMRQVAAAGAKLGMEVTLLPRNLTADHPPIYDTAGNVQFTQLLSATHHIPSSNPPDQILQDLAIQGHKPYWIPSGASTHPLGGLGYARWAFEVELQERELGIYFDVILVACMSGSTLGGMLAGFALSNKIHRQGGGYVRKRRGIGVAAGPKAEGELEALVLQIARDTGEKIGLEEGDVREEDVEIDARWTGGAYGMLDEGTKEAVKLLAGKEGIIADPVYSAKALRGLIERIKNNELGDGGNLLFVHTGGVAAVSAYPDLR